MTVMCKTGKLSDSSHVTACALPASLDLGGFKSCFAGSKIAARLLDQVQSLGCVYHILNDRFISAHIWNIKLYVARVSTSKVHMRVIAEMIVHLFNMMGPTLRVECK